MLNELKKLVFLLIITDKAEKTQYLPLSNMILKSKILSLEGACSVPDSYLGTLYQ